MKCQSSTVSYKWLAISGTSVAKVFSSEKTNAMHYQLDWTLQKLGNNITFVRINNNSEVRYTMAESSETIEHHYYQIYQLSEGLNMHAHNWVQWPHITYLYLQICQISEGVNIHQTYQLSEGVNTHQTYQYQRVWTHMYTKTESSVTTHQADLPFDLPIFSRYEQIPVTDAWMAQGPSLTLLQPAHQDTSQNQKQKLWHMQPCSLQCLVYVKAYSHRLLGCAQNVYAFMGVWKCLISS